MIRLGVNIDHVATVRQARMIDEPDPAWAVVQAELGGADQITLHLREDRRHIQDHDLTRIMGIASVPVNLEMAVTEEMISIAQREKPASVTIVPEKRKEVTTEGGLDVVTNREAVTECVGKLANAGIKVALFIDPDERQVEASLKTGCVGVEFHTGAYCELFGTHAQNGEYERLWRGCELALAAGLHVHAGHGLNVRNLPPVIKLPGLEELNIGHSIVGRAIFLGMKDAVAEMKAIIQREEFAG